MASSRITSVGIVVKPNHAEARNTAGQLASWLAERGVKTCDEPFEAGEPLSSEALAADLIVVLGGDGTMISTARMAGGSDVLVLGINYGSLGYLTEFRIEEMFPALEAIIAGNYDLDPREMLEVEQIREGEVVSSGRVLNDVVINKAALARIIESEVRLNGLYVNTFRSDGLIVSTPTGSTAYNLSAGGPIIFPSMRAIVLTPICPFTLTNRPIVIPDDADVEIELKHENEGVVLSLDGQIGYSMIAGDIIRIRKAASTFNLVQPSNRNYFDVLRDKLKWGR